MNTSTYLAEQDQLFQKLEASHQHKKMVSPNLRAWTIGVFTVSASCLVAPVVAALYFDMSEKPSVLLASTGLIAAIYLASIANTDDSLRPFATKCLGVFGKTLPLSSEQVKSVAEWCQNHPRLVPILANWASLNSEGELNCSDYMRVRKIYHKLHENKANLARAQEADAIFQEVGLTSQTNRLKLSKIAAQSAPRPGPSKPAM